MDDDLMTQERAAELAGFSVRWLHKLGPKGPPFIRIAQRTVIYRRDEVLRWAASHPRSRRGRPRKVDLLKKAAA